MTEQEFRENAAKIVESVVNKIADKQYEELASVAYVDSSWAKQGQTQEQGFSAFGEWLDEQLALWESDEERKFVVDRFDESCLGEIELEEDNTSFTTYNPTSFGEELDFWFEFKFQAEENGLITTEFNVNF